jgi:hypothetical protein
MDTARTLGLWLAALGVAGLLLGAAGAQPADQGAAMVRTVLDQLAAFRRDDWSSAYAFASAGIQKQFGPEAFRAMVTQGYAPIARSRTATLGRIEVLDGQHGLVEVRVEGENGETIDALYELIEEQGAWRVNGVLTRPVERGTPASIPAGRPAPA